MTTENKYPDFCVANYSPEHWKATQKVLTDCGIEIQFLLNGIATITDKESNNPKGVYVRNGVASVLVTDAGFETAQEVCPLTIKTRNIYRHVGKLNIFDSAELTDYSPNTKLIELKPVVEYNPFSVKTSLFKKFLITLKAIINHFR
ncbi:hypothetical protein fBA2_010 [Acinetobacter virus fBenAci002]|uniref:Uncharacterized protein n=1 Tax=Acinetobacter virus fBenAci002 TaxID=2781369 RepID=A0A7S6RAD4_9CAUD|nr:hypothetical protein fBA2_010 [Acinetobacter virus fBenAci002]